MSIIDKLFGGHDKPRDIPAKPDGPMQKVLDELASLGGQPIETLTPAEARRQPTPTDAVNALLRKAGKEPKADDLGVNITDLTIPGAAGQIQARIYKPHDHSEDKLHPVVVYFHGGGFVIADLDVYDGGPRGVSRMADAIVVSVHYRQAPEHHFPAAHDDALAAYRWVLDNAQSFNGDPQKVAVMGESAGGNLAIGVSMMARDAGLPAPVHQVLVYPVAGVDMNTESYVENAAAKPLEQADDAVVREAHLRKRRRRPGSARQHRRKCGPDRPAVVDCDLRRDRPLAFGRRTAGRKIGAGGR